MEPSLAGNDGMQDGIDLMQNVNEAGEATESSPPDVEIRLQYTSSTLCRCPVLLANHTHTRVSIAVHQRCRTEFRSMEMQATDAENAAFIIFVVLVTRVILAFDLNLYIPLSKVDENMKRAHVRDGVHQKKVLIAWGWRRGLRLRLVLFPLVPSLR